MASDALQEKRELLNNLKRKLKNVQEKGVELNREENADLRVQKLKVSEEATCLEAMGRYLTIERQRYECFIGEKFLFFFKENFGKMVVGQLVIGQMVIGQMVIGQMVIGRMVIGQK